MKSSGIGGQAVLEGVMMKNQNRYAVAVRRPDGGIEVETWSCHSVAEKSVFFRLPIIRGVVAFVESLVLGMKTLTYSSGFYEEEETEEEGKTENIKKNTSESAEKKESLENILIVILSILLAIVFFMLLPFGVSELLRGRIGSETTLALIEGVLRVLLFLGYVVAISFMKDIRRVYMYHGAEHKTINCVERGLELNVENVRRQTRRHRRCGTSFLLVVMFVSIVFFLFIHIDNIWLRMVFRILLIPVIAGVSYEFIRFAGNSNSRLMAVLSAPGLLLQALTTREPDDDMIEVAIASVEAVFDWRAYQEKERERAKRRGKKKARKRKSRSQTKKELAKREQEYRERASERRRQLEEQEQKEAAHEKMYQEARKRTRERIAATQNLPVITDEMISEPVGKVDIEDDLKNLDRFFDADTPEDKESGPSVDQEDV